jgi:hypothetical protein
MYPFKRDSIQTASPIPPSPKVTGAPARYIMILIRHYRIRHVSSIKERQDEYEISLGKR